MADEAEGQPISSSNSRHPLRNLCAPESARLARQRRLRDEQLICGMSIPTSGLIRIYRVTRQGMLGIPRGKHHFQPSSDLDFRTASLFSPVPSSRAFVSTLIFMMAVRIGRSWRLNKINKTNKLSSREMYIPND